MTKIKNAKNLGSVSTRELESIGIKTLEDLIQRGWQEVLLMLIAESPKNKNLNFARALIGAQYNCDWRAIPEEELVKAKELLENIQY